jgi:hypothetical protein
VDLITCKLKFLRDLHKKLGDQKIDVALNRVSHSADRLRWAFSQLQPYVPLAANPSEVTTNGS